MIEIENDSKNTELASKLRTELSKHSQDIMDFFGLKEVTGFKIKIWNDLDAYRLDLETHLGERNYQEWMIAHTYGGNINMLGFELVKQLKSHADDTEKDFLETICHEFVHICHDRSTSIPAGHNGWFWEMLATNLGNPSNFDGWTPPDFSKFTIEDLKFRFDEINGYPLVFYMGQFVLSKYTNEQILDWVKSPDKLDEVSAELYQQTIAHYS